MQNKAVRSAAILHLWQRYRITYMPIVTIVAVMAQDEIRGFEETLEDWAASNPCLGGVDYHWPAARWRSEICYRLLKAGEEAPGGVAEWFKERAKEVRELAEGNDLGAGPGTGPVVVARGGCGTPDSSAGAGMDDMER